MLLLLFFKLSLDDPFENHKANFPLKYSFFLEVWKLIFPFHNKSISACRLAIHRLEVTRTDLRNRIAKEVLT